MADGPARPEPGIQPLRRKRTRDRGPDQFASGCFWVMLPIVLLILAGLMKLVAEFGRHGW